MAESNIHRLLLSHLQFSKNGKLTKSNGILNSATATLRKKDPNMLKDMPNSIKLSLNSRILAQICKSEIYLRLHLNVVS